MNNNKDKVLYIIAVLNYKKEHQELNDYNLFPVDWNLCKDYHLKNIIIAQAIKENILVDETELYQKYILEKTL